MLHVTVTLVKAFRDIYGMGQISLYRLQPSSREYTGPKAAKSGPSIPMEVAGGEDILSLRDLLPGVWKRLWIVMLVPVVLMGAAAGFSFMQTPTYEASIKILVGQERGITQNPNDVMGLQQLTRTLAATVNSRPIADEVISQYDLPMTREEFQEKHLTVEQIQDTQVVEVSYEDSSPERAQQVANSVGDIFAERLSEASSSAGAITATVWERAVTPDKPVRPNPLLNILLALVLGLLLGVGLALLLEHLDDSWRSPEEAEQISGAPNFGYIPKFKSLASKRGES